MSAPTYDELVALVANFQAEIVASRKALDESQRKGKRQAAPFSKGILAPKPKSPGRKPGKKYVSPTKL